MLPHAVRGFYRRADARARAAGDAFQPRVATRPAEARGLLEVGGGGATRSSSIRRGESMDDGVARALGDRGVPRDLPMTPSSTPTATEYVEELVAASVPSDGIELRAQTEADGRHDGDAAVTMLFVELHGRQRIDVRGFAVWRPALAPDAIRRLPRLRPCRLPGMREAIEEVKIDGEARDAALHLSAPEAEREGRLPGHLQAEINRVNRAVSRGSLWYRRRQRDRPGRRRLFCGPGGFRS